MNQSRRLRLSKLSLGLVVALAAAPAFAQSTSAGVGGLVTDNGGQPVAGAEVTITHVESGTVSRATTDASGRYNARGLRVGGPYQVTVTKSGSGTKTEDNVFLGLNQVNTVNAALTGDMATLETVTAVGFAGGSEVFSSSKMGAGTNLSRQQIEALPSANRNIQDYVRMDPRIAQSDKARGEISVGGQNPRYNAIRIDGINTSDTFGLESNNFPTMRQPVSMDAIEAINVDISNYDTTITGATGAVIDAVTKSGTNEFHGSVYGAYRDGDWWGEHPVSGADFTGFNKEQTYGATFGGPLVKDKLFFFVNYEKFERDRAASSYGPVGSGANTIVNITPEQIAEAQQIARDVYNVDIGSMQSPSSIKNEVEEYAAKLDWNINDNHRVSARFSKLEQIEPNLAGSSNRMNYNSHNVATFGPALGLNSRWYDITKEVETSVVQLFSDWSDNFSTEFKVGRRTYDSLSTVYSRLPQVVITFGDTGVTPPYLNFGTDEFRHGNQINTTTDNAFGAATWYVGDHTLKFGFDWERNEVYNLYAQNIWGTYVFAGLDAFRNGQYSVYDLNAPVPGNDLDSVAMRYKHANTGVFVQDSWAVNYNLTLLFGLRVDKPSMDDVPVHNLLVQEYYGYDNRAKLDDALVQPRFGFNYTFDSDRPTQLRGGLGLFQGAAANVWVGNSYQNTGFGLISYNDRNTADGWLPVELDDVNNMPKPDPASGYGMMVNLMDKDFEQPSVWKANLAFDTELPWHGIVASAELLYTKVNNGLHFERLDLGAPTYRDAANDGRTFYWQNINGTTVDPDGSGPLRPTIGNARANGSAGVAALADTIPGYENVTGWAGDGVLLMKNTDNGRSAQLTVGLSKPLVDTWGWSLNYTYTNATEVSPLTSSRAISNWSNKAVFDPNSDEAATSNYEIRDRITGSVQFRKAFFGDYNTIFSVFYEGRSGAPHSWRYVNDMNGDGYTNDLLYIPEAAGDVIFTGGAAMEAAFFEWVTANGLEGYRGDVVERNSQRNSWVNQFDLRVSQELPGFFKGHKSEIWLDVMNVGNLINKDWGRIQYNSGYSDRGAVFFQGVDPATGKYVYNFNADPVSSSNPNGVTSEAWTDWESRWSLQLGFRYKF
ncbi:TonB-dependent receptor [Pseudoxanthomonas mexicana]